MRTGTSFRAGDTDARIMAQKRRRFPHFRNTLAVSSLAVVVFGLVGAAAAGQTGKTPFAYTGPQYVITVEIGGSHSFVVNVINLSDFVIVVQASDLIYRGASGRYYIGQVFEQDHSDTRGEPQKYKASVLLKGQTFTGLTVLGAFRELDQIEEMSIRIGAKRFYLEPLEQVHFEQLAAKIGELDMKKGSPMEALREANIPEIGKTRSPDGTSEWDRDWQGLLNAEGVNPPRIIERLDVTPTDEARRANVHGKLRLNAVINKNGGIQDLKVLKGLGRGLDERALDAVKNSWVFLPATKNGEVVETNVTFEIEIPPSTEAKRP
jgi:TonB family protein